jgi:hypothetical protein
MRVERIFSIKDNAGFPYRCKEKGELLLRQIVIV